MDNLPAAQCHDFIRDLYGVRTAVAGKYISNSWMNISYKHWMSNCADSGIDHRIQHPQLPIIEILQVFGHQMRHCNYYTHVVEMEGLLQ